MVNVRQRKVMSTKVPPLIVPEVVAAVSKMKKIVYVFL
jgi:hypothetical protein